MKWNVNLHRTGRNLTIYAFGLGLSVTGALGLAAAIALHWVVSLMLFIVGLGAILLVHERFDGPI